MDIFVSIDGDSIGSQVGRASLADDVAEVRRLSKLITDGNQLWTKWALGVGGQVVSDGGDEVVVQVDASRIGEIPQLRQQYNELVEATVSVGIGMRLSEAQKALLVAKVEGKDRIVTYGPHVENTIQNLSLQQDEQQKLQHEYLARAEEIPEAIQGTASDPHMDGLLQSMEGGHGQEGAREEKQPRDFLQDFHAAADKQKQDAEAHALEAANDGLKMKIAAILQKLKGDPKVLAVLQQKNPQLAGAIGEMAQAMIAMGRQLWAEQSDPNEGSSAEVIEQPGVAPAQKAESSDWGFSGQNQTRPQTPEVPANNRPDAGGGAHESKAEPDMNKVGPEGEILPEKTAEESHLDKADAYVGDHKGCGGDVKQNLDPGHQGELKCVKCGKEVPHGQLGAMHKDEIEKAATEAGTTGRHNVILPPGSQKDTSPSGAREGGKRKVEHADGKSSWQSMRSGVVPSPTGRPTSAKHPGGLPKDKAQLGPEHYSDGDLPQ